MKAQAATAIAVYRSDIQPSQHKRHRFVLAELDWYFISTKQWPTALELLVWVNRSRARQVDVNAIRPRLHELWTLGSVIKGEKRRCRVSGKTSLTWELPRGNGRLF